ncbi:AAA-like domain-containing protein [Brasilonema sp. CT11]|nr:AAA-like domain-containing protein [Brasilonema sp. CT11]
MSRLVVLSLGQGNLHEGCAMVTAQLGEADNPYQMKFTASLPPAPKIYELYQTWQSVYYAFYQRLSWRLDNEVDDNFEIAEDCITNISEADINGLRKLLSKKINTWLNSTKFRKIDQQLRTQLKPSEEIRFIIETNDHLLRRLPWHLWKFFEDYPYAEVALSAPEYQNTNKLLVNHRTGKVRILAIFGNSQGIDISQDKTLLDKLSTQAEVQFLIEPNLGHLNEQLWQPNWDILFFAGHSFSQEKGFLQINKTDTITLEQLKYGLRQAISRGLKLAIFNSCDGLGLAQELQDLQIPQVIVMREPVPDVVAQEFLKYFLAEFSTGKSLYNAVRSARERLQGLEVEYPCATWLPMIFQNPAEPSMIWSQQNVWTKRKQKTDFSMLASTPNARGVQTNIRLPVVTSVFSQTTALDSLIEVLNGKFLEYQNHPLNHTEILVLRGIWQSQTYNQIAQQGGYSDSYSTKTVARRLCQKLSDLIGNRVTKKNCRTLLQSYVTTQASPKITLEQRPSVRNFPNFQHEMSPRFPSGLVPLGSPYYIEQSEITTQVYKEIINPGALIRMKAPQEMGKTSLLLRIVEYAKQIGYHTVSLNLQEQIDQTILSDLNRFLRWLCANISCQLELEPRLDEFWDEDIGSKVSCSLYLRNYVLEQINSPLVLALDEVNQIFEHPQVAKEFLPLLRSWYEDAKRQPIWQKLRLIVVHSTEVYVPLDLNQSPFNVGLPIELNYFSLEQVQELAQRFGLNWTNDEARLVTDIVGGHPSLVHLTLYHLSRGEVALGQLLQTAATPTSIYYRHIQPYWATLKVQPELALALSAVMSATKPVRLEPILAYKLKSMGLIKLDNNLATPSCRLYQEYFQLKCQISAS